MSLAYFLIWIPKAIAPQSLTSKQKPSSFSCNFAGRQICPACEKPILTHSKKSHFKVSEFHYEVSSNSSMLNEQYLSTALLQSAVHLAFSCSMASWRTAASSGWHLSLSDLPRRVMPSTADCFPPSVRWNSLCFWTWALILSGSVCITLLSLSMIASKAFKLLKTS